MWRMVTGMADGDGGGAMITSSVAFVCAHLFAGHYPIQQYRHTTPQKSHQRTHSKKREIVNRDGFQ